ncbi:uncharacterized protein N7482_007280 [Penicillium canariense]|uniref:Zn(2)-C6 fungal-type domain-containing protein n=1 Tax=Penicillium canariense TaxID=189055 RepID=A0A9W9LKF7_9EURO|nr:uncharacterized protein N7482_007280 [Penicillium canariense]KAJ5160276.1 hypothetical protein N7482_007280 [Penicillium canariense]
MRGITLGCEADSDDDLSQCDEKKPICTNCDNHGVDCSFSTVTPTIPASESPSANANISETSPEEQPKTRSRRFQPYQYSTGGVKQTFKLSKPKDQTQPPIRSTEAGSKFISLADLQLFHNYTVATYRTIVDDGDQYGIWQTQIVQWGMEFPSILHLILAMSALHLAYNNPASRDKYIQQADEHFTFGVRTVTNILSQLDAENCQKIYIAAVLICFIYFGRGPWPGEYLIFSDTGAAEWQVLLRGVKLILMSHHAKVFSGILEPKGEEPEHSLSDSMRVELHEHTIHVEALRRLVEQEITDEADRSMCTAAINDLLEIMREVYTKRSHGNPGVGLMHLLIGWIYRLPGELVGRLEQKESRALVILAHWVVLLKYMDSVWFMRGWAEHVLMGISASLQPEYQYWIEWPLRRVQQAD